MSVAVLVGCVVAVERFDGARALIESVRDLSGDGAARSARPAHFVVAWVAVTAVGALLAIYSGKRLVEDASNRRSADIAVRARFLAWSTGAVWVAWSLSGAIFAAPSASVTALRGGAHLVAIVLLAATLLIVGPDVIGSPMAVWHRAKAIRLELIVVAVLFALVFLVPLTAAQLSEVLRAWGHDALSRAAAGIATALVLGVVLRASAIRVLAFGLGGTPRRGGVQWIAVLAAAAGLAVAAGLLRAWGGLTAVGLAVVAFLFSTPGSPPEAPTPKDLLRCRRLADTLGLVPLAILVVGLADATTDSWLLPVGGAEAPLRLTLITAMAVLLLGVLAGHAYVHVGGCGPRRTARAVRVVAPALPAAALAYLAGIAIPAWGGFWGMVPVWAFLAGALLLAFRALGDDPLVEVSASGGVALGVALAVYLRPVDAPRTLGAFACVFAALTGGLVALHVLEQWAIRQRMRHPSWMTPWPKSVPVVTLVAVWAAVALVKAPQTQHQARTVARSGTPQSLQEAVDGWLNSEATKGNYAPMLLVGASGGGSKAGYWTDLVLDCLLSDDRSPNPKTHECGKGRNAGRRLGGLFLTSSVSGGSVGVYDFMTRLSDALQGAPWIDDTIGKELLSPTVAWGAFHDLPDLLLDLPTNPNHCTSALRCRISADRAWVQEAAMTGADDELDHLPRDGVLRHVAGTPFTVFNASLNRSTGRFIISPLELSPSYPQSDACRAAADGRPLPGALDAHDVLDANEDIPASTAALLSGRFPLVAPPARVGNHDSKNTRGCVPPELPLTAVRVRDGGYVENTGLLTITNLLPSIRREIRRWASANHRRKLRVPIVVLSIDDDPAVLAPNPSLQEPPSGLLSIASRVGSSYLTRKARDAITTCQYSDTTYVQVSPAPHTGAHAATGWEVSSTGRHRDLGDALNDGTPAMYRLQYVRDMLDGTSTPQSCRHLPAK